MTANVEYSTAAAAARLAAALTATGAPGQSVDGAAGAGQLVVGAATLSGATGVLATIALAKPSFSIAARVATLAGVPLSATASAGGAAALAELRDSAGTTIVSGLTVGAVGSGAAIELAATTIVAGETVQITGGAITHP